MKAAASCTHPHWCRRNWFKVPFGVVTAKKFTRFIGHSSLIFFYIYSGTPDLWFGIPDDQQTIWIHWRDFTQWRWGEIFYRIFLVHGINFAQRETPVRNISRYANIFLENSPINSINQQVIRKIIEYLSVEIFLWFLFYFVVISWSYSSNKFFPDFKLTLIDE